MIDFSNNPVRHIALLRRHVIQVLDGALAPHGLGYGTYKYLYALYLENNCSQQALADRVADNKAAATRALARLEQQGLICRQASPHDKRVVLVTLTPAGDALRAAVNSAVALASTSITSALTQQEAEQLQALLYKAAAPLTTLTVPDDARPSTKEH